LTKGSIYLIGNATLLVRWVFRIINPKKVIPIHYNDYDVFKSPLEDFQAAVREAGLEDKVHYIRHGETYNFQIQTLKDRSSVSGQGA